MATTECIAASPSVQLFVERAIAARPDFCLTPGNARAIADICIRLDGLPLAIELAAARIAVLSPEQILARLDDALSILVSVAQGDARRHRTLRAAIEWSYRLLNPAEQTLLQSLSVMRGRCSLEAIDAITTIAECSQPSALDALSGLVRKSLVVADHHDESEPRFRLLDTVRLFAHEQLVAAGREGDARDRHLEYFTGLAERALAEVEGPHAKQWVIRLEHERDNLRAALYWASENQQPDLQLRLAASAAQPQWMAGHLSEPLANIEMALSAVCSMPSLVHALALHIAGMLIGITRGDLPEALARLTASVDEFRALGATRELALALGDQGFFHVATGNIGLGAGVLEETYAMGRLAGDDLVVGYSQFRMGQAALLQLQFGNAVTALDEAVAIGKRHHYLRLTAHALCNLVCALARTGDGVRADTLARECVSAMLELGDAWALTAAILCSAVSAQTQGNLERAARLFGAADAQRATMGAVAIGAVQSAVSLSIVETRKQMGEQAFQQLSARGSLLTSTEIIDLALGHSEADPERVPPIAQ